MLGNGVAERRHASGRQPLHHLGRLVEVGIPVTSVSRAGSCSRSRASPRRSVVVWSGGAGAHHEWLTPRLAFEQHWLLIDQRPSVATSPTRGSADPPLTADVVILTSAPWID